MDNLDHLSDDELRRRLLQFGFPNMPVTSSTRKILIKKLRNYMDAERSKLRRETTHATRYSSDEEQSDRASTASSTTNSSSRPMRLGRSAAARATIAGSLPPPTAIPEPASGGGGRSQFLRPSSAKYQTHQAQPASIGGPAVASRINLKLSRPTLLSTSPLPASQPTAVAARMSVSRSPTVYVSPMLQGSSGDEDTDEDAPDFGPTHSSTAHSSSANGQSTAAGESQYISDFKQRLLNLRGLTMAKDPHGRLRQSGPPSALSSPFKRPRTPRHFPNIANHNNNHYADTSLISNSSDLSAVNNTSSSSNSGNAGRRNWLAVAFAAVLQKLGNLCAIGKHSSMVPCILHTLLLAFFVLVAIAYLAINPNLANTIQAADTKHTVCTAELHALGVPCIEAADLEPALQMIRRTAVELQRRAVERRCGGATPHSTASSTEPSAPPHMSAKEVVHVALEASAGHASVQSIRAALLDMEYLLHSNRQWGIQRCDSAGTLSEWSPDDQQPSTHYIIPNPSLSLRCKFYTKMQTFYTLVGTVALAGAVGWAAFALYQYVRRWRRNRKEAVDFFIAGIIQALMEKAAGVETADEALVVTNHLRDQLIRPAQRGSMAWAWSEAIRFLEANESRIHFEVGTHNGEDCQMMRWAAEQSAHRARLSAAAAATPAIKKWQSPAFDKLNKIRDPPTPCLKIRHMFEPHEPVTNALRMGIQDAILEKVHNTGCRIYDVQLDAQSCCVYVRCATPADAGIVHEQINGWWFDSRLVSIKFLHLERYVSRFPKGQTGPKCMQPSNTKMLSMSGCSGQSGPNGSSAVVDEADEY